MAEIRSRFGCKVEGCTAHPRNGDAILRTSPLRTPFKGVCRDHCTPEQRAELDRHVSVAADAMASRVNIIPENLNG